MSRKLTLVGGALLVLVMLTHIAEHWQIFPAMGWGQPGSPGHYVNLFSVVGGFGCLLASFVMRQFSRWRTTYR